MSLQNFERNWVIIVLALVCFVIALSLGEPIFFSLTYLLVGILLISWLWAWLNVHWVRVSRNVRNHYVQVGHFFEEQLSIENTGPLPKLWIELKDSSNLPYHQASRVVSRVGRKQQRHWRVRTPCYRRGRYKLGPISILSSDPFGLFLFSKALPENFVSHIIIFPMAVDIPGFQPPFGELAGGEAIHRRTHYTTTNVAGVRDYVFGDSFKRIHWRSTARLGRLMVKEFELDPVSDIWIFLDMDTTVQVGLSYNEIVLPEIPQVHWEKPPAFKLAPSSEEYSITIAASLSRHFLQQGRSVGLITYPHSTHREIAQIDRGERQLTRIYETLAVTQAYGNVGLAEVLAIEGVRLSRSTTAIIITPSTNPKWVAGVRHLMDKGIRTTAIFVDPTSFGTPADSTSIQVELTANRVPYYLVKNEDDLAEALAISH